MVFRVLILDEDAAEIDTLSKVVSTLGWKVLAVNDIRSALNAAGDQPVDLIVLGARVGGENTLDHLQWFRAAAPAAPIAIVTETRAGSSDVKTLRNRLQASKVEFILQKPIVAEKLTKIMAEVEAALEAHKSMIRVLVIDDNKPLCAIVGHALSAAGFITFEANSMEDALNRVDISHIHIAITDIFMPGMGGIEGIKIIRKNWPGVGIIAMSAGLRQKVRAYDALVAASRIGAMELLEKPFTPETLVSTLSNLVNKLNAGVPTEIEFLDF